MTSITNKELFEAMGSDIPVECYSGRGMGGRQCCSINANSIFEGLKNLINALSEMGHSPDQIADLVGDTKSDSMGRGVVLYWPYLPWDDSFEDVEEDEE